MLKKTILTLPLAAFGLAQMASAAVTVSSTAPSANVISSAVGGIDSAIFDEDASDNHARGQLFSLPEDGSVSTTYEVAAITIKKSTDQTYVNDTMTLYIFEGTEADWTTGTGHSTATDGSNYYVGTTVTPLYSETFTLNDSYTNNSYVTFTLDTPLIMNEDSDFGFFFVYDQVDGTEDRFRYREGSNGGRISIGTTVHAVSTRQMEYYVQVVPEPSAALLGAFGLLGLLRRRR